MPRRNLTCCPGGPLAASQELFEAVDRFCNQAGTVATSLRRVLRLGPVDALVTRAELALLQAIAAFGLQNPSVTIDFAIPGRIARARGVDEAVCVPVEGDRNRDFGPDPARAPVFAAWCVFARRDA